MSRRAFLNLVAAAVLMLPANGAARADDKVKAVASFSILGDMVRNVGGDRVEVVTLVGPNGDAHVFQPSPADARTLAEADVFVVNGLGFEGWMERLKDSSGFKGTLVTASNGIAPRGLEEGHGGDIDPHAWQSLANGKIYVANIRDALIAADPEGRAIYEANANKYLAALAAEEDAAKAAIAKLPPARRRVITSHDAFGYFGNAYGVEFIAPEGVSTESEASAKDVAKIIRQIRSEKIPAVFLENVSDRRLLDQIAAETGARIGGTLYSDALSGADGPAPTYLDMFRHNVQALSAALSS